MSGSHFGVSIGWRLGCGLSMGDYHRLYIFTGLTLAPNASLSKKEDYFE